MNILSTTILAQVHYIYLPDIVINQWKRMISFLVIKVVTFVWIGLEEAVTICLDEVKMLSACACTVASHQTVWQCDQSMEDNDIILGDKSCYFCFDLFWRSCYFFDEVGLWSCPVPAQVHHIQPLDILINQSKRMRLFFLINEWNIEC